ncbi:multi-sensor hybrid histidine kinase [Enterobacter cloacae]|uniref:Multi-sensor hybrid histidine kinase n=1 Tax=Enterobacter cloacae TaxID=550 RepID=A0A377LU04_ENTCL|nr:multi-sensor hybrid histidine kinase [Enterobacter cloacae]
MNDYLAKPIDEEKLHNLLLALISRGISAVRIPYQQNQLRFSVNQNATFDWQLALRQAGGETRFSPRDATDAGRVSAGNSQ